MCKQAALEKFGDPKIVDSYNATLFTVAEVAGPKFLAGLICTGFAKISKPKALAESCAFLGKLVDNFGVRTLDIKEIIEFAKTNTNHTNPTIRSGGLNLIKVIY